MFMTRPIRDIRNHEQQHVSDRENDQGPAPDNHTRKPLDCGFSWHRHRLLHFRLRSTVQRTVTFTKGDTSSYNEVVVPGRR
jgi:hypothetical protein